MNGRHAKGSHMDEKAYERLAVLVAPDFYDRYKERLRALGIEVER